MNEIVSNSPQTAIDHEAHRHRVSVALISDDGYVIPTATAIHSMIAHRRPGTYYVVNVIASGMSQENMATLSRLAAPNVDINIVEASAEPLRDLHAFDPTAIAAATIDALLKFFLPALLPDESRVLYLDGDILVQDDLSELFSTELAGNYIAAVPDSGAIYFRHEYVTRVDRYFNSGVMLLDLDAWRRDGITERLVSRKREIRDSSLLDQNVFNLEFDGRVKLLPPRYNVLWMNLVNAIQSGKLSIDQFNEHFDTAYPSFDHVRNDAAVLHFSSKKKPWRFSDTPGSDIWYMEFLAAALPASVQRCTNALQGHGLSDRVRISVIIPFFKSEQYLRDAISSILTQDLAEIEVLCVDDGSPDNSVRVVEDLQRSDPRVRLLRQPNQGAGAARNHALREAVGEYILFVDSDDWLRPRSLLKLYTRAAEQDLDVLLFEGSSHYEHPDLEITHPTYRTYYSYKNSYNDVYSGPALFEVMARNWDLKDSAALRLVRRAMLLEHDISFPEGIVREDCYFAFATLTSAKRAAVSDQQAYVRRVRDGSVMTGSQAADHYRGLLTVVNLILHRLGSSPSASELYAPTIIRIESYLALAQSFAERMPVDERARVLADNVTLANVLSMARMAAAQMRRTTKLAEENASLKSELDRRVTALRRARGQSSALKAQLSEVRKELTDVKRSRRYRLGSVIVGPATGLGSRVRR